MAIIKGTFLEVSSNHLLIYHLLELHQMSINKLIWQRECDPLYTRQNQNHSLS